MAILPNYNFRPIVQQQAELPLDELDQSLVRLNQRYDVAQQNLSDFEKARNSLLAAGYEGDQAAMEQLKQRYNEDYNALLERDDLENVMRQAKKLNTDFANRAVTLQQRREDYQKTLGKAQSQAAQGNLNINRFMDALHAIESKNPTLVDQGDGTYMSAFDEAKISPLFMKEANAQEIAMKYASMIKADTTVNELISKNVAELPSGAIADEIRTKKFSELTAEEITRVLETAFANDKDMQILKSKEEFYGEVLGDNRYENIKNNAILTAANTFDFVNEENRLKLANILNPDKGGNGGNVDPSKIPFLDLNEAAGQMITDVNQFKSISSNIKALEKSNNPVDRDKAKVLKQTLDYYTDKATSGLTPTDKQIYKLFSAYNGKDVFDALTMTSNNLITKSDGYSDDQKEKYQEIRNAFDEYVTTSPEGQKLKRDNAKSSLTPQEIVDIISRVDQEVQQRLKDIPPITRAGTSVMSTGDDPDSKGSLGNFMEEVNKKKQNYNISLAKSFTLDDATSWKDYFRENYIKPKTEGRDGEYAKLDWNLVPRSGWSIDGYPMMDVNITGLNKRDGSDTIDNIGTESVILGGENAYSQILDIADRIERDIPGQNFEKKQKLTQIVSEMRNGAFKLPNGKRSAQVVMQNNTYSMPAGEWNDPNDVEVDLGGGVKVTYSKWIDRGNPDDPSDDVPVVNVIRSNGKTVKIEGTDQPANLYGREADIMSVLNQEVIKKFSKSPNNE